ncbi:MAG: ATP synthase F0 subunit B [Acidobacteria bacterium]|nr:ATP synthase F0 subunit B [Acidobacteriota bacterium]
MRTLLRRVAITAGLMLALSFACAIALCAQQSPSQHPAEKGHASSDQKTSNQGSAEREEPFGPAAELTEESREAAGEEGAEFKQSSSVRWFARVTGLSPLTAYWILVALNFVIIAVLLLLLLKAKLPAMFRDRSVSIRKSLDEARQASAEAQQRLAAIEARLGKLDAEIAAMRATAEQESRAEEERIRATTEQDRQKIVAASEQEIAAAAGLARRELKAYVADLAVTLAEKRIQVNSSTDEELVRSFVEEIGENGR